MAQLSRALVRRPTAYVSGMVFSRLLKNPLLRRLLKKAQVQGGARIPQSAIRPSTGSGRAELVEARIPQWGRGPFSAAC
jgi:hypothetical protein